MEINNSGFNTMQRSISSYLEDRLSGNTVTAESESTAVVNGDAVEISISPEAKEALAAIERATNAYTSVSNVLGATSLDASVQVLLSEIAAELDQIYGNNIKPTSESYLMLGGERQGANDLITDINALFAISPRTDAENELLNKKVTEFDEILARDSATASHAVSHLSIDKQKEVMTMFANLADKSEGLETNSLSQTNLNESATISTQIDKLFETNGTLLPAKELSSAEEARADELLSDIDDIMKQAGAESISSKLRLTQEQTYATFLDMLTGNNSSQESEDPLLEFMNNRYGNASAVSSTGNLNLAQLNAYTQTSLF